MSTNTSLVEFYNRLSSDAAFKSQVKATGSSAGLVEMATRLGYTFTEDEFCTFIANQNTDRELGDNELETVAGGRACQWSAETKNKTAGGTNVCCWG